MALIEKLEHWAKELDCIRWNSGQYDVEAVELSDLLQEAAKLLRGQAVLIDEARHAMAKH